MESNVPDIESLDTAFEAARKQEKLKAYKALLTYIEQTAQKFERTKVTTGLDV